MSLGERVSFSPMSLIGLHLQSNLPPFYLILFKESSSNFALMHYFIICYLCLYFSYLLPQFVCVSIPLLQLFPTLCKLLCALDVVHYSCLLIFRYTNIHIFPRFFLHMSLIRTRICTYNIQYLLSQNKFNSYYSITYYLQPLFPIFFQVLFLRCFFDFFFPFSYKPQPFLVSPISLHFFSTHLIFCEILYQFSF